MKSKLLLLILAVVFGLAAVYATYQYIQHIQKTYQASGKYVSVAVAKTMIPARQVITEQMIQFTEIPANYVNPAVLGKPIDIMGKIARDDIHPGEQILKSKVVNPGDPSEGLAMLVEPGRRAIAVAVNDVIGVAGLLKPGDHVDILGTVVVGKDTVTSTLVQNIKILAVNKSLDSQVNKQLDAKQSQTATITLSVNPNEAQHITLATEKGSIRLVLRTPADAEKPAVPSTNMNHLVR